MEIDVTRDYYEDTPLGKDPDDRSPSLRLAHALLWSKEIDRGHRLELCMPPSRSQGYLYYLDTEGRQVWVGSDAWTNSYTSWNAIPELTAAKAALNAEQRIRYLNPCYTIGQTMVWPVGIAKPTINQARGTTRAIDDRADLTLECIRLHYAGEPNPMMKTLTAYADWFKMFRDFGSFVRFFFLDDLVDSNFEHVTFWTPVTGFSRRGVPTTEAEYIAYREATLEFIDRREERIATWLRSSAN